MLLKEKSRNFLVYHKEISDLHTIVSTALNRKSQLVHVVMFQVK